MSISKVRGCVTTNIQSAGEGSESSKKRLLNIQWIEKLKRPKNLAFNGKQHQLLIYRTSNLEEIFIQYPGKESLRANETRPWDFRPKYKYNGKYGSDVGFNNIWALLFDYYKKNNRKRIEALRILGVMFYRMAFMVDHRRGDIDIERYELFDGAAAKKITSIRSSNLLIYRPNPKVLEYLMVNFKNHFGMSVEAFLAYNDLLAWNEDCKYYYRSQKERRLEWIIGTGRVNNLLTHVSLICVLLDIVPLADFLGKLQRGVVRPTRNQIVALGDGMIVS